MGMRWDGQGVRVDDGALPGLQRIGFVRSVRTPQFEGITFHEVLCKSAINKIPDAAMLPFKYTVNGYRGCSHACRYCFARPTHEYLEFDPGNDFDREIVVKTNVADVLRRELHRPSWQRDTIALGTNTDPYQRAEGRYALMPGIIGALADSGTPFSILTKGTLLRRDLPLLTAAAEQVPISLAISLAVARSGVRCRRPCGSGRAPRRRARHSVTAGAAGADRCDPRGGLRLPCDGRAGTAVSHRLSRAPRRAARPDRKARARTSVTVFGLHLRGSTRGWFMSWLGRSHPELVSRYRELYRRGAYLPQDYREMLRRRAAPLVAKHGLTGDRREFTAPPAAAEKVAAVQPTLF